MSGKSKKFFDPVERATMLSAALNQDLSVSLEGDDRYALFFRKNQYVSTLKKVEAETSNERLHQEALAAFLHRNRALEPVNLLLASCQPDNDSVLGYVLLRARHLVRWVLGDISTEEIFDASRHSNGVSRGVPFMDTSLNQKSSLPWTATERALKIVLNYWQYDPLYYLGCCEVSNQPLSALSNFNIVNGSRATTVPKQFDARRMIAIEPTGNMFLQQGLMHIMYRRLAEVGLDVKTLPDRHKDLAFWSSVSGHLATLDLSNASDTVSLELVRYLFSPKWFYWLNATRSPTMLINDEEVSLAAYATMGNATTFPVETLVFWAISCSCVMFSRYKKHYGVRPWKLASVLTSHEDRAAVSVFGDDIILPTSAVPDVLYCLGQLGFSINSKKSFYDEGLSFRESCGGDFYHGRDVRPWFIRGPTTYTRIGLEAWLYVMANTLLKKYRTYFGGVGYMYEKRAFGLILEWLSQVTPLIKVVPATFPDDSGLQGLEGLRLARTYLPKEKISPVGRSEQGWYSFRYLRFRYPKEKKVLEALEYASRLKTFYRAPPRSPKWFDYLPVSESPTSYSPLRKKGEYIVARSTHFSF